MPFYRIWALVSMNLWDIFCFSVIYSEYRLNTNKSHFLIDLPPFYTNLYESISLLFSIHWGRRGIAKSGPMQLVAKAAGLTYADDHSPVSAKKSLTKLYYLC
jgi:hypothetical protein